MLQCWGRCGLPNVDGAAFNNSFLVAGLCSTLLGDNLAKTLLLNLAPFEFFRAFPRNICYEDGTDCAAWEQHADLSEREREPLGIADWLTWQRRFTKIERQDGGMITSYRQRPGFKHSGDREKDSGTSRGVGVSSILIDPFHAFRIKEVKKGGKRDAQILTISGSKDRLAWRDLDSIVNAIDASEKAPATAIPALKNLAKLRGRGLPLPKVFAMRVCGIAGETGKDKTDAWVDCSFRIPAILVDSEDALRQLRHCLERAESSQRIVSGAIRKYAETYLKHSSSNADKDAVGKFTNSLFRETDFWASLEAPFHRLLEGLDGDGAEDAVKEWENTLCDAAERTFNASLNTADSSGRHWRALTEAQRHFSRAKWKLFPKEDTDEDKE